MAGTLYFSPLECLRHEPNDGHPECPERLLTLDGMATITPNGPALRDDLLRAHTAEYLEKLTTQIPSAGLNFLDPDTALCPNSWAAAIHAAGAVMAAVEAVLTQKNTNAFCAVRPPGHHAHRTHGAGFCLLNNVVIGALAALDKYGLTRVAILDFDVHHGDGTQDIIGADARVLFASTYQYPLYAATAQTSHTPNNLPFPVRTDGTEIVAAWRNTLLPRVRAFNPEMIFVSAGFDGHRDDPIGGLNFTTQDYADLMQDIKDIANRQCHGRLVAVLEGGYDIDALADCVGACLNIMESR